MDKPFLLKVRQAISNKRAGIKLSDILAGLPYNTRRIYLYRENKEESISRLLLIDTTHSVIKIVETDLNMLSPYILTSSDFDEWDKNCYVVKTSIKKYFTKGYMTAEEVLFSKELNYQIPASVKNIYHLSEIMNKAEFTLLSGIKIEYIEPKN